MINHKALDQILLSTGMLHFRMQADETGTLENRLQKKPVVATQALWNNKDISCFDHSGLGRIYMQEDEHLVLESPTRTDCWPEGSPDDGDYCAFGYLEAALQPSQKDWRSYNRLRFKLYPDCNGMHSPTAGVRLFNDGTIKIPDAYNREGFHTLHLKNHQWNECIWEFPSLPRDEVTRLVFEIPSYGKELSMSDTLTFYLKDIYLECTPEPEHTLGWNCAENTVAFSTQGYFSDGNKTAVTGMETETFEVYDAENHKVVYTDTPSLLVNEKGTFYIWDFTSLQQEGCFYLKSGTYQSSQFEISSDPLTETICKVLNFLYCERCGYPVGRGHGTCHGDILAEHNGLKLAYNGGWHDAGDVSQQTLQTAEVTHSLLEMASRIQETEPALYYRIMEEAAWGLDFVLRMRFGDGYRASSAGIRRFSNGFIGDMDDCEARVHNHAFENFMMAGIEAYAAFLFQTLDPELSEKAYCAACEDFNWAEERFREKGMELPIFFEHSYNSSLSLYYAAASFAASNLYCFKNNPVHAASAVSYGDLMLSCQETGEHGCPMSGFFYREPDKKTMVHFNHQSREQLYMQALELLCRTQPKHVKKQEWERSMKLYGGYLKQLFSYSAPYGMLPAGIHKMDEYLDSKTFPLLHLMTAYEEEKDHYKEQLAHAIPLNENYCIKQFPVWFSFRGNAAIHLSSGKAASLLGRYFGDSSLIEIAREQLYWLFGKNPFCQSLIYGAGSNYASQYGALNGEMVGSIPVGIETRGNDDVPFWPMENNATYKEVWTTSAGRWLWVAADLIGI